MTIRGIWKKTQEIDCASTFLDNLVATNNGGEFKYAYEIYPPELELKKTTTQDLYLQHFCILISNIDNQHFSITLND